jgi:hypothetical protein
MAWLVALALLAVVLVLTARGLRAGYVGLLPALAVAALYLAACAAPALEMNVFDRPGAPGGEVPGWVLLYLGAIAIFVPSWWLAWWANPVLILGWFLLLARRARGAAVAGAVALFLSLGTWLPPVGEPRVGYFLWVGSMAALVGGSLWTRTRLARRTEPEPSPDDPEAGVDEGW